MIEVVPLTFRDCCFVSANIREEDWQECRCQLFEDSKYALGNMCFFSSAEDLRWCVRMQGQPVAIFGLLTTGPNLYQGWMYGTRRLPRVLPALRQFLNTEVRRILHEKEARRVEIRALDRHELVSRGWLEGLGAQDCGPLHQYGKNGETFRLFAWWKDMPVRRVEAYDTDMDDLFDDEVKDVLFLIPKDTKAGTNSDGSHERQP